MQAAAPTRSKLATYRALQAEAAEPARMNQRPSWSGSWRNRSCLSHPPSRARRGVRALPGGRPCIVSSLHDGMNLVAKEFVAARDDEQGVLILSSFAGASRELSEALIVNPYRHAPDGRGDRIWRCGMPAPSSQRDGCGRCGTLVRLAQRLPMGGADAARRGSPQATREHQRRSGGLAKSSKNWRLTDDKGTQTPRRMDGRARRHCRIVARSRKHRQF